MDPERVSAEDEAAIRADLGTPAGVVRHYRGLGMSRGRTVLLYPGAEVEIRQNGASYRLTNAVKTLTRLTLDGTRKVPADLKTRVVTERTKLPPVVDPLEPRDTLGGGARG